MGKAPRKKSSKDAREVAKRAASLRALAAKHRELEEAARKTGSAAAKKALAFVRKHSDKFFKFGITKVSQWFERGKTYGSPTQGGKIERPLFHPPEKYNHAGYRMTKIAVLVGRRAGTAAETHAHMLSRLQAENVYSGGLAAAHWSWTDEDRLLLYAVESIPTVSSLDHAAELVNESMRRRGIDGICVRDSRLNDLTVLSSDEAFDEFTCAVRKKFGEPAVLQMMAEVLDAQSPAQTVLEWMGKISKKLLEKYSYENTRAAYSYDERASSYDEHDGHEAVAYRSPKAPFGRQFARQWRAFVEAYLDADDDDA